MVYIQHFEDQFSEMTFILHFHQQCMQVSICLHLCQHLLLSILFIVAIFMGVKWYFIVFLTWCWAFLCVYWPFACLWRRIILLVVMMLLWWGIGSLSHHNSIITTRELTSFPLQVPYQIFDVQIFSLILWIVFWLFWWHPLKHKSFWFWWSSFVAILSYLLIRSLF